MNNKIKCIMRYLELYGYSEIAEYLISNKMVEATDVASKNHTQERAELIYFALKDAEAKEKLLLLDFEWKILPLEQIKITCVSTREERHFTHGY